MQKKRRQLGLHVVGHFSHLVHGTEFVQDWYTSLGVATLRRLVTCGIIMAFFFRESTRPGKRLHNYGKSPFLMGQLTINGHFQ